MGQPQRGNEPHRSTAIHQTAGRQNPEPLRKARDNEGQEPAEFRRLRRRWRILWTILIFSAVLFVSTLVLWATNVKPPDILSAAGVAASAASHSAESLASAASGSPVDEGTALAVKGANRKSQFYTFLLCGTDQASGNTDTIMVAAFDAANNKFYEVSIPRDTMINVSWSIKKINSAYPYAGIDELKKQVTKLLGFEVDNTAVVDLEAFKKIVDTIGGVDFDVPQAMNYDDPYQDLYIHFEAGMQHLNGEQALAVCRFRYGYPTQDLGRIQTQQKFLMTVARQLLQLQNVTKLGDLAKIASENLQTNMTYGNLIWLGLKLKNLSPENIEFYTLSGGTQTYRGVSYSYVSVSELLKIVNQTVNPYTTPITTSNLNVLTMVGGIPQSTTGTIAGGIDSFLNSGSYSAPANNAPAATEKPAASPSPGASAEPLPSASKAPAPSEAPQTEAPSPSAGGTAQPKPSGTAQASEAPLPPTPEAVPAEPSISAGPADDTPQETEAASPSPSESTIEPT